MLRHGRRDGQLYNGNGDGEGTSRARSDGEKEVEVVGGERARAGEERREGRSALGALVGGKLVRGSERAEDAPRVVAWKPVLMPATERVEPHDEQAAQEVGGP